MKATTLLVKALLHSVVILMVLLWFIDDPDMELFVAFFMWPTFFASSLMWQVGSKSPSTASGADYIKMQNFYNLDAMRRNSDQERNNSWRKIK